MNCTKYLYNMTKKKINKLIFQQSFHFNCFSLVDLFSNNDKHVENNNNKNIYIKRKQVNAFTSGVEASLEFTQMYKIEYEREYYEVKLLLP